MYIVFSTGKDESQLNAPISNSRSPDDAMNTVPASINAHQLSIKAEVTTFPTPTLTPWMSTAPAALSSVAVEENEYEGETL